MGPERSRNPLDTTSNPVNVDDGTTNLQPTSAPVPADTSQPTNVATASSKVDDRVDDENFLLCVALCYLGLPPSIWRTITNCFLEAVSAEYREQHGAEKGSQEFEEFKALFQTWSTFNKFKTLANFLAGEGIVGKLALKSAGAVAVRARILELLVRLGVKSGTIAGASQILRKVNIYLELAWLSGCAGYCGSMAYANAVLSFAAVVGEALSKYIDVANAAGQALQAGIAAAFFRPVVVSRAMLDPSNWDTTPMGKDALMLTLLGNAVWPKLNAKDPEAFLANLIKPMSSFGFSPSVLSDVAAAMTRAYNARGGFQVTFTPTLIMDMTPIAFVQFLKDWRLLRFNKDPQQIADEEMKKLGN
jgi:hypothetical protein